MRDHFKNAYIGLLITFLLCTLTYFVSAQLDLFERMLPFLDAYEEYEVDELFFVALVLLISVIVLAMKLWHENAMLKVEAELFQLKALLPICANCKKIKDDDGYWHQVEAYIRSHTGTEFSHGLCDKCLVQLYPEVAKKTKEVA